MSTKGNKVNKKCALTSLMGLDETLDEGVEVEQEELEKEERVSITSSRTAQNQQMWKSERGY